MSATAFFNNVETVLDFFQDMGGDFVWGEAPDGECPVCRGTNYEHLATCIRGQYE